MCKVHGYNDGFVRYVRRPADNSNDLQKAILASAQEDPQVTMRP